MARMPNPRVLVEVLRGGNLRARLRAARDGQAAVRLQLVAAAVDLGVLDRVLQAEVRDRFDHRNINLEVPEFAEGKLMPTGENLARFIFERVQRGLGDVAKVVRVTVAEDRTLSATYEE